MFMIAVAILFLLWWFFHRQQPMTAPDGSPLAYNDPQLLTYASNPGAFGPQTVNGSINVNVNGAGSLSNQYIPLFGFVGMAQGVMYS
jgi:hypothetical protein